MCRVLNNNRYSVLHNIALVVTRVHLCLSSEICVYLTALLGEK